MMEHLQEEGIISSELYFRIRNAYVKWSAETQTLRQTLDRFCAVSWCWLEPVHRCGLRSQRVKKKVFQLRQNRTLEQILCVVHKYVLLHCRYYYSCLKKNLRHPGRFLLQCSVHFAFAPPQLPPKQCKIDYRVFKNWKNILSALIWRVFFRSRVGYLITCIWIGFFSCS